MKRLRAGIIGLGVGEQHIEGYRRHPDCDVVALCDVSERRVEEARARYPDLRVVRDPAEILGDPDIHVVSIASYDNHHAEQIETALRNNKHVFAEKPLCLYEEEARRIRALLRARPGLRLSSNLILRCCPRFRWLKAAVQQNRLGSVFYVEADYEYGRLHKITEGWRGQIEYYSVMLGGGLHMVDLLLWLLNGDVVEEVSALAGNLATRDTTFRHPDLVACLLKFKSGRVGKVTANFACMRPHFHRLAIYGTGGTFINEPARGLMYTSRDRDEAPQEILEAYPGYHKGDLIHSFVEAILENKTAGVSEDEVFRALAVCFAAERSRQEGKPVAVEDL